MIVPLVGFSSGEATAGVIVIAEIVKAMTLTVIFPRRWAKGYQACRGIRAGS
jgi:orotate phosphoribosyltransferase